MPTIELHVPDTMKRCIDACTSCHQICMDTVMFCLQKGGEHARPEHIQLLLDCAGICQLSAEFMLRSPRDGSERGHGGDDGEDHERPPEQPTPPRHGGVREPGQRPQRPEHDDRVHDERVERHTVEFHACRVGREAGNSL